MRSPLAQEVHAAKAEAARCREQEAAAGRAAERLQQRYGQQLTLQHSCEAVGSEKAADVEQAFNMTILAAR